MKICISIGLLFALATLVIGQDDLIVEKSFGPKTYPPAARAVRAQGNVSVQVEIDENGNVVEATGISGHPLLRPVSIEAARKWEFSKFTDIKGKKNRTIALHFNFTIGGLKQIDSGETAEEELVENIFTSTFSVDSAWVTVVPRLLQLPRKNGKIPTKLCPIHEAEMFVEILKPGCSGNHSYVTYSSGPQRPSIGDVEGELFPNANVEVFTTCREKSIEQIEVQYCSFCRIRRNEWIRDNPQ